MTPRVLPPLTPQDWAILQDLETFHADAVAAGTDKIGARTKDVTGASADDKRRRLQKLVRRGYIRQEWMALRPPAATREVATYFLTVEGRGMLDQARRLAASIVDQVDG